MKDVPFARAYLDDVAVFFKSLEKNIDHLSIVFDKLQGPQLKICIEKYSFAQESIELPRHIVFKNGVMTDPKKTWLFVKLLCQLISMLSEVS